MTETENKTDRQGAFVDWVISRALDDNGFRAAMKRADNPNTEPQRGGTSSRFAIWATNVTGWRLG